MAFGGLRGSLTGNVNNILATFATTAGSIAVSVGDLIYAVIAEQATASATACNDNLGNTYAATSAAADAGTICTGRAFWTRVTNAGTLTTVTFTTAATTNNACCIAAVIEGPFVSSPLDANPANTVNDLSTPYTCPATPTLAQADEAVLCWMVQNGAVTLSATSPNLIVGATVPTQAILSLAVGRQVVAATTAVTPAWTSSVVPTQSCFGTTSFKKDLTPPAIKHRMFAVF